MTSREIYISMRRKQLVHRLFGLTIDQAYALAAAVWPWEDEK